MNEPERKPLRLKDYDYSQNGGYFITFCTENRAPILGHIVVGGGVLDAPQVELSAAGQITKQCICGLEQFYPWLTVAKYVIMPNHVHLLLLVQDGPPGTSAPTGKTIPQLISTIKRLTNRAWGTPLWQRGIYDHILRDGQDFLIHWDYIETNPGKWAEDEYHI